MKRQALRAAALAASLAVANVLTGCAPLLVGGAVLGGTLMATDRRTSGAQVEDQAIELKSMNRIRDVVGDRGHVSTTSYNRVVLITGEVQTEADKTAVEQAVQRVENVKSTVNELEIMGPSSLTSRSNDAILSSKVKASFVDAKDLFANSFKVTSERGTVYLMGRVTEREANRATEVARSVSGVQKVVRLFEIITEQELADMAPKAPAK
ncbi:BON domain-containing protein [Piscinibacter sp. XHJ-5]|uniref:BON domain-containing protein n=1 Tax=Piscinibacter sp. XHJ-5 TaxID=3037797 RepID=UPI0024536AA4|nr:BON domain-containing protein [Piscinibacter sp. XHJ-5]